MLIAKLNERETKLLKTKGNMVIKMWLNLKSEIFLIISIIKLLYHSDIYLI